MGKWPTKSGNIRLTPGSKPPPDKDVKLPSQVQHAAAVADALVTGQPVPPKRTSPSLAGSGFPHTNADIDDALQRLQQGKLQVGDPEFRVIHDLAKEGAQHIKSRRRGAQRPRAISDMVIFRRRAVLEGYQQLSPKLREKYTGVVTVRKLRNFVVKKLNLSDDEVSEDAILSDIQQLRPLMRLIREGKIPPSFFGNS
jgi:hypothetical protein